MPRRRNLDLTRFGVSKHRYIELRSYCLQYQEWQAKLQHKTNSLKSQQLTGMPFIDGISNTTCDLAISRVELQRNCQLIEQTIIEAICTIRKGDSGRYLYKDFNMLYDHMLLAVTSEDITYDYLYMMRNIPISRDAFYSLKRYFFCLLDKNKR